MVKLTGIFNKIRRNKIMVVGDFLLDTYTIGKAKRISPEAPVAVVHVQREENRPGGAGNVALNLVSLESDVVIIGRVGDDQAGKTLLEFLKSEGIDISGMYIQHDFPTPVKNRILAENQQIVRIDYESVQPISEMLEQKIIEALPRLMDGVKVLAISDYGKGFLSKTLLAALIELAKQQNIIVIADPKGLDFSRYSGATIIKPNLGEAYAAANLPHDAPLEQVASRILHLSGADVLMVTRSEAGISLFHRGGNRSDFPVKKREIKDVTGAGDTVLAMLSCALASDLPIPTAVQLSNIAAGIAIERFGCARISLCELARRLLEEDVNNKVFDEEHLFALQRVLKHRKFSLLSIDSSQGLTANLFSTIRQFGEIKERELLLFLRDSNPEPEFIQLLASLYDVDYILLKGESLKSVCFMNFPEEIFIMDKGGGRYVNSIEEVSPVFSANV